MNSCFRFCPCFSCTRMIQWNAISDILELAKNPQFQDVILVCNNGKMKCNSIVLSLVSPQIQNALSSFPEFDLEKMITIMCLEIDIQDIKQFLNNILNQKEEISSCKALVDLLGHSQLGVKIEVDIVYICILHFVKHSLRAYHKKFHLSRSNGS